MHKAGSSFYQKNVFPNLKNIDYLGFYKSNYLLNEIRYLQTCNNLHFDINKITKLKKYLSKLKKNNQNVLISSEAFSGNLGTFNIGNCSQLEAISERVLDTFENAKIIFFLRNQKDSIYSLYCDDIQFGYTVNFENWITERLKNNSLNYFLYFEIIRYYQNKFGKKNVYVFNFENLFNKKGLKIFMNTLGLDLGNLDKINFSNKINNAKPNSIIFFTRYLNKFIKTKLNMGYTDGYYEELKIYNFWRYKASNFLAKIFTKKKIPNSKAFELFLNQCKLNNLKLEKIIGYKLPKNYFFK